MSFYIGYVTYPRYGNLKYEEFCTSRMLSTFTCPVGVSSITHTNTVMPFSVKSYILSLISMTNLCLNSTEVSCSLVEKVRHLQ